MKIKSIALSLLAFLTVAAQSKLQQRQYKQQSHSCPYCKNSIVKVDGIQVGLNQLKHHINVLNPYCRRFQGNRCVQCAQRTYMENGKCRQIDPNCKTFDPKLGCSTCYPGYRTHQGKCILSNQNKDYSYSDPYCAQWQNRKCVKCSQGCFFRNGICVQADPNCKSYNQYGCTDCYQGYKLLNGKCTVSNQNQDYSYSDPYCAQWKNGKCVRCSQWSYFKNGVCAQADPNCKTYNQVGCTDCYQGYKLLNGKCVISNYFKDYSYSDPYCAQWKDGNCVQCSRGSYFKDGLCNQIDPNCKTFDPNYGCVSCFSGYHELNGECIIGQKADHCQCAHQQLKSTAFPNTTLETKVDKHCWQFEQEKCTKCFAGFSLRSDGTCYCSNYD